MWHLKRQRDREIFAGGFSTHLEQYAAATGSCWMALRSGFIFALELTIGLCSVLKRTHSFTDGPGRRLALRLFKRLARLACKRATALGGDHAISSLPFVTVVDGRGALLYFATETALPDPRGDRRTRVSTTPRLRIGRSQSRVAALND